MTGLGGIGMTGGVGMRRLVTMVGDSFPLKRDRNDKGLERKRANKIRPYG